MKVSRGFVWVLMGLGWASAALAQPATTRPAGLDSLSDDRLLAELATRRLDTLLERAFEVNNVAPDKRQGITILMQLQRLSDPAEKLSPVQRQEIVRSVAGGISAALPTLKDPRLLMQYASNLLTHGVERDVNTLEYWGENPRTQAELRPVVEAVIQTLDKAHKEATDAANKIAESIKAPNSPFIKQWEQADQLASTAEYTKHMVLYDLALSMDKSDPKRKQVAQQAIDYLQQHDNADSGVQPIVRNRIAKLHMAIGQYSKAKELFAPVAEAADSIQPKPDVARQYEARYFMALCDILNKDIAAGRQGLEALRTWQDGNLPKDNPQAIKGAQAAAEMMEYRLLSAQAEQAKDEAAKQQFNQQAIQILLALVEKQPALGSIIYEQLVNRLPDNPDYATLDLLMLRAILEKGDQERLRDDDKHDHPTMERAILAGRELLTRRDTPRDLADTAAILIPFLLDKLDRRAEGAAAFMDYLEKTPGKYRDTAFEYAGSTVFALRRDNPDDPRAGELFDRFLPIAINPPYNHVEYALLYARRLMLRDKYKEAISYFQLVPKTDKNLLDARFYQMLALKGWLDTDPGIASDQRTQVLAQIQSLADEVRQTARDRLASATDNQAREEFRSILVKTTLLSADVAHKDQDDSRRTLEVLSGFEEAAKGLKDENDLLTRAQYLRVHSYMQLGQSAQAAESLRPMLEGKEAGAAAAMVYGMLKQLDEDLDKAIAQDNVDDIRQLTQARAALTPYLVKWAQTNPDPEVGKQLYRYKVFDAESQRRAAAMTSDSGQRQQALENVLTVYQELQSPENVKLYQATLTNPRLRAEPDPTVQFGIAMIRYDLGQWQQARDLLSQLLDKGKLGTGTMEVNDPASGQIKVVDNDIYWEARYKLVDANWRVASAANDPALKEQVANDLRLLYVKWMDRIGGKLYKARFESLRQQIAPDFTPPKAAAAQ